MTDRQEGEVIDGILFDKDGTLFDFQDTWADWVRWLLTDLAQGDAALVARLAAVLGFDHAAGEFHPDSPVIAETIGTVAGLLQPLLPQMAPDQLEARMNELAAAVPLAMPLPLRPLLHGLRQRGLRLGVATNDAEAPARAQLARADILSLFDFVVGYDSGHGAKPDPGQLLAFCAVAGVAPGRVAMVGDSRHDLLAAQRAGMRGVGVLTGLATRDELATLAEVVLEDVGGLPGWLDGHRDGAAQ